MRILLAFIFLFSQITWGQVSNKTAEFNYVWGADYFTNWVLNPSANLNLSNTTTSNATLTRDTTTKLNNVASFNLDTSATSGYAEFTLGTVVAPATAGNCEYKGIYKGDASLLSAQVLDGSSNVLASAALQNSSTNWQTFSVYYPCAASGSRKVRITQTTAGTTAAINLGKLYYGQQTNGGAGVPNNTFSAKISSAGVVSEENEDFINGNCTMAGAIATCTWVTAKFTTAPTCTVDPVVTGAYTSNIYSAPTTTQIQLQTFLTTSGAGSAGNLNLICTRSSTDWIQPTITAPNWDTDWQSYTLTIGAVTTPPTQGAGATNTAKWRRVGDSMEISFTYAQTAAGTVGSGAYLLPIPSGYTIDTNKVTVSTGAIGAGGTIVGNGQISNTNATNTVNANYASVIPYNSTNLQVITNNGSGNVLQPWGSGTYSLNSTSIYVSFIAKVPIQGWTKTLSAPMLVGSVTSNTTGALRIETLTVQSSCTASPCTVTASSSAWYSSVTRSAAGAYSIAVPAGTYSSAPICVANPGDTAIATYPNSRTCSAGTETTTAVPILCGSTANVAADSSFQVICMGAR